MRMRTGSICLALFALLSQTSCTSVVCGQGTIERNGTCEPADVNTNPGTCGPGTKLVGDTCESTVMCDPATSMPVTDPNTGITTCVGIGGGGCTSCTAPTDSSKQTICGQIYDFETGMPFADTGATGMPCPATPTSSGPCALKILAYDAVQFATDPMTATPLQVSSVCIDDAGHFRLSNVTIPVSPLIGIGIDDAAAADMGPGGVTNSVGIAVPKAGMTATKNVEHFIVTSATTTSWVNSGGPGIGGGIFAGVFRAHACPMGNCTGDPLAEQAGVTFVKPRGTEYYFQAADTTRTTIDTTATATGANGTGLLTGVALSDGFTFSGAGGITDTVNCKWESHAAAALPNIVLVQIFRKMNQVGKTCAE
jgi:hypothetical protein